MLYPLAEETNDAELAEAIAAMGSAREEIDLAWQLCTRIRDICQHYLVSIGAAGDPLETASPSQQTSSTTTMQTRVRRARDALPKAKPGARTEGWRLRSDGNDEPIRSGERLSNGEYDPAFVAAARRAWELKLVPPTAPPRLAGHVEIKMAVQMRAGQRETIVIDRPPCGLADQEWLRCHRQLPRFLPPGAELTVITSAGETYTYQGEQRNEA